MNAPVKSAARSARQERANERFSRRFVLKDVKPMTPTQEVYFKSFKEGNNFLLHGYAGTGKSFNSLYLSFKEILRGIGFKENAPYERIVIIRSAVPTRDMGFMPGSQKEKAMMYEEPYAAITQELFPEVNNPYDELKTAGYLHFTTTSYIRGITLNKSIILVDEIQNMDWDELVSIITRVGPGSKIIFSGDFRQSDFRGRDEKYRDDIHEFMSVIEDMPDDFQVIEFEIDDIVRNPLVKRFILKATEKDLL